MNICLPKICLQCSRQNPPLAKRALLDSSSQMCSQYPEFECLGKDVMDALKRREKTAVYKNWHCFWLSGGSFSFGRYYYRYIYLGKELWHYSFDENGKFTIYVSCGNRTGRYQNTGRFRTGSEVVQECRTLGDWGECWVFYDWVYDNVSYDQTLKNRTIYDAVINGNAVCWGYVSAYLMLCRNAGLICEPVYAETMHGTEPGFSWWGVRILWYYGTSKVWEGTRWEFLTQKDMDLDSMHNNLWYSGMGDDE